MYLNITKKEKIKRVMLSMKEKDFQDLKVVARHYGIKNSQLVREAIKKLKEDIKKPGNN